MSRDLAHKLLVAAFGYTGCIPEFPEGHIHGQLCNRFVEILAPTTNACIFGEYCSRHGFMHGAEAEQLRKEFERHADSEEGGAHWFVRRILDKVDARDSLAYLEHRKAESAE